MSIHKKTLWHVYHSNLISHSFFEQIKFFKLLTSNHIIYSVACSGLNKVPKSLYKVIIILTSGLEDTLVKLLKRTVDKSKKTQTPQATFAPHRSVLLNDKLQERPFQRLNQFCKLIVSSDFRMRRNKPDNKYVFLFLHTVSTVMVDRSV